METDSKHLLVKPGADGLCKTFTFVLNRMTSINESDFNIVTCKLLHHTIKLKPFFLNIDRCKGLHTPLSALPIIPSTLDTSRLQT